VKPFDAREPVKSGIEGHDSPDIMLLHARKITTWPAEIAALDLSQHLCDVGRREGVPRSGTHDFELSARIAGRLVPPRRAECPAHLFGHRHSVRSGDTLDLPPLGLVEQYLEPLIHVDEPI
jgi:hypothetical protein